MQAVQAPSQVEHVLPFRYLPPTQLAQALGPNPVQVRHWPLQAAQELSVLTQYWLLVQSRLQVVPFKVNPKAHA